MRYTKKNQKLYNEFKTELDKKVNILKVLLECDNILYVDIMTVAREIESLKDDIIGLEQINQLALKQESFEQ